MHKCIRLEDLNLPQFDDPELSEFLRLEIGRLWGVVDWQQAKIEVCSKIDDLLSKGSVIKIAWYGDGVQAKKVLHELISLYDIEGIQWFIIEKDLNETEDQLQAKTVLLNDWCYEDFNLTINAVRDTPLLFSSTHESSREDVLSPFSSEQCQFRAWNKNLKNARIFLEKINAELENNKVIVFIALRHGNFPSIEHIAKGLAQLSGVKVYGIYLESDIPENVYEDVFTCNYSLGLLAELVRNLPSMAVYLQAHASWAFLGRFVSSANKKLRVIQEVYDWMGAFIADEALFSCEGVFSTKQISLMKESEDYIRNFSDGYIYKDDGSWMKDKVRNSSSPSLKIYPCPPLAYLKEPKEPEKNAVIKLVYAGQVSHERQSKKIFGDMYYIPVIKDLTNQGFHVTVYNAVQNTRRHPLELYQEYLDEADNSDLFEFKSGIPMPDILDELHGKYHFGLIAYYFEDDLHVGKDHIKGTMASKLFTYLASGMPVIVSDQFEYMAKIVESEGIGIVVARNDLQNLARLLDSFDYQEMLDNVLLAQQKYNIDSKIPEIMELLEA